MSSLIGDPRVSTLDRIFAGNLSALAVPIYQRDYAWGDDQVDDFIADLPVMSAGKEHFFGTLVMSKTAPGATEQTGRVTHQYVIDGQQRLITSLLTLVAIQHLLVDLGASVGDSVSEKAERQAAALVPYTAVGHDIESRQPRLSANRLNQELLTPLLTQRSPLAGPVRNRGDVERLFNDLSEDVQDRSGGMHRAYTRIYDSLGRRVLDGIDASDCSSLDELTTESARGDAWEALRSMADGLLTLGQFVEISVPRWEDAFAVFEGLNNRGLELSERDLVKNAILAKAATPGVTADRLQELERQWDRLTSRIAESKFVRFLRHYMLLHYPDVPLKRVVRTLNDHFREASAEQMMAELEAAAEAYAKITKPGRLRGPLKVALQRLNLLEAERAYPIPLAALLKRLPTEEVVRLLTAVEVLYFRRSTIMGKDNKAIENDLREIAADIYAHGRKALPEAMGSLARLTPRDDEFRAAFEYRDRIKDATARYMLVRMENHLTSGRTTEVVYEGVTLEHILPKEPTPWNLSEADLEAHPLWVMRIGNLTLLRGSTNSAISNRPFEEKKRIYVKDGLEINRLVEEAGDWGPTEIKVRQVALADLACEIWCPASEGRSW
jgi:hypothetical protein